MNPRQLGTACATSALLIASLSTATLAVAEDAAPASPHSFTGNVALTTNYLFRGISQTGNGPAIQGGFNYSYTPLSLNAGIWGSNVDSAPGGYSGANMETDFLASWTPTYDKLGVDLGYVRYEYFNTTFINNNTNEFHLGLSYDLTYVKPKFTANYSDDWYGDGESWYYDLTAAVPLPYDFTLTGHYGWSHFTGDLNYVNYEDYSVGISREFGGFGFALAWVDRTNTDACVSPLDCGSTAVFTISKAF
jgi:uncharacterized protein (TIGR02001 family)